MLVVLEKDIEDKMLLGLHFDSLNDESVTIRDRDTMEQVRIKISELDSYFMEKFEY